MDLKGLLPTLLPDAVAWAESHQQHVASAGTPLATELLAVARTVGVQHPERIRVKIVDELPLPEDPVLRNAALQAGLLGPEMVGLTLGYSIFIVHDNLSTRLVSHECRHVHQYETFGSMDKFLPAYLQQIVEYGYHNAPFEIDARAHEIQSA